MSKCAHCHHDCDNQDLLIRTIKDYIYDLEKELEKYKQATTKEKSVTGCSIHGECPYCRANKIIGDPRESVSIKVK